MCGIAGFIGGRAGETSFAEHLDGLLDLIGHRGPDDRGVFVADEAALGMCRLSIIDVAGGHQPMSDPDERAVIVFNGEIYNYRELRDQLRAKGHAFRTASDTEVVLHGFLEWGDSVVDHLEGMFAFAIWDRIERRALLARDRFGVKPLYYLPSPEGFAFCSEPAPLLTLPWVGRRLDLDSLAEFLAFKYVKSPNTFVEGVQQLESGTLLRVDGRGAATPRRYWTLEHPGHDPSPDDAAAELRELLTQSVRRQMVSDVPIGVFLSGGIDSGLLAWAASSGTTDAVDAYTIGFEEQAFDETALAGETAQHLSVRHHVDQLRFPGPEELDVITRSFGEPFANSSVPANFLVSRVAAEDLKVVLNGTGADELFAGYDRYYAVHPTLSLRLAGLLSPLLKPLLGMARAGEGKRSLVNRARRFVELPSRPSARHEAAIRLFPENRLAAIAPTLRSPVDGPAAVFESAPGSDDLQRATWTDVNTMLPNDYLTLVDRTSMAASLEVRVPYLDTRLAEWAFGLSTSLKIRRGEKKFLLRMLARSVLPSTVTSGAKRGFESPVGRWFRTGLEDELPGRIREVGLDQVLVLDELDRIIRDHRTRSSDASQELLGMFTLATWMAQYRVTL